MLLAQADRFWWDVGGLLSLPALVALNGFFVAAEFALVAVRRTRIEELIAQGVTGASSVLRTIDHLDRVIALCAKHDIYTILDLHTAPGSQNTDWHSDACTRIPKFCDHKDFQDRVHWLWGEL